MHKALVAIVVLGLTGRAWAGDDVEELVEAVNADEFIHLTFQDGKTNPFYFSVDKNGSTASSRPLPAHLTVATDATNGLNITLQYLNPIRYSWSTSEQVSDEPTYASASKFLESMQTLLGTVSPQSAETAQATKELSEMGTEAAKRKAFLTARASNESPKEFEPIQEFYSPQLLEWSLWMSQKGSCTANAADQLNKFFAALAAADKHLYEARDDKKDGGSNSERASKAFRVDATEILNSFLAAQTVKDLKASVLSHKDTVEELKKKNTAAAKALEAVEPTLAALEPLWDSTAADCKNLKTYTKGVIGEFKSAGQAVLATRVKLVEDLDALKKNVDALLSDSGANDKEDLFRIASVQFPHGKQKDVTITIRQRDVSMTGNTLKVEGKGEFKATVRVREYQTIIVEFAPGVAYTNVAYPRFGTTLVDGRLVVTDAGKDIQHTTVVGMLNLIPNWGWRGIPWLIGQIGVGTGKDYPLLLAGAGIRFRSPFDLSITFGGAWTWTQQLNALKLGDEVTGTADIEKDLSYQIQARPKFYLGIQRGF